MNDLISIEITGNIPEVNDKIPMEDISDIMLRSVQMNILMGGRPDPWTMRHQNETPLIGSGKMYNSLTPSFGNDWAQVEVPTSVRSSKGFYYPRALNDGATVPPVEGKLMVFELDGRTIFTMRRRGFQLGPFAFMMFQDEDIEKILQLIPEAIFSRS